MFGTFESELLEVIEKDKLEAFKKGEDSGISFDILEEVFERLIDQIPEIFQVIDNLVIELTDNL